MNDYINLTFLGTFAGMIIVLNLLVEFFKPLLDKVTKIPTRFLVWFIAIILSVVYQAIAGSFTLESIFLLFLNSIILTLAAMGSYEVTLKKLEK
jgi:hypothetical protein